MTQNSDQPAEGVCRYHDSRKPNTCESCDGNVVVLIAGECIECTESIVSPTSSAIENDWEPEVADV